MSAWHDSTGAVVLAGIGFISVNPIAVNQNPSGDQIYKPGWKGYNQYSCMCADEECILIGSTVPGLGQGWVSYWMDGICVIGYTNILIDDPDNWNCHSATVGGCG